MLSQYEIFMKSDLHTLARRAENQPSAENFFVLGLKYADCLEFENAATAMQRADELDPKDAAAFYAGLFLFQLSRFAEAEVWFNRVSPTFDLHSTDFYLGEIYRLTSRRELAAAAYRRALRTHVKLEPGVHVGLTELLEAGVDVGFGQFQAPIVSERIVLNSGGRTLHAFVRVFRDLTTEGRKVAVFTSESGEFACHRHGMGVINGAELLVEHMTTCARNRLSLETTTFVVMFEQAFPGGNPFRANRLTFETASRNPLRLRNVGFSFIPHAELERLIGFRFFWNE